MIAPITVPPTCQVILLWSWSRFSREQDDAHFWKAALRRRGIHFDVSGETPSVEGFEYVIESLIHWKDEQRLDEISRDAKRGQQTLARMGYVPSGAEPPRGYRVAFEEQDINGRRRRLRRWEPDPETWPLVERAWAMRLHGASYSAILDETHLFRSPGCLSSFFSNTIYKGELRFGETVIGVPGVVTAEEWSTVNASRPQHRGGVYSRRQGSRFLLSGLLHCARCGSALGGDSSADRVCAAMGPNGSAGTFTSV